MNQQDDEVRLLRKDNIGTDNEIPVPVTPLDRSNEYETRRERRSSDIAIIGISGRFADSPNLEALWDHLQTGESCIEEIQHKGWQTGAHSDPDTESVSTSQVKWGGMLQDIDQFDPLFFNISPQEAERMDPQQRLFLEEAYKAFEDAGYSAEQLSGKKVGVFVGARSSDYKEQALQSEEADARLFLGNDMAILAARISYFLNIKGPSLTIDTASSSSLVAIHLACESIHTGESEMALAGGVFVMSSPEYAMMAAKTQMLSPDGKCKTFDKSANGIVIGEGVGALVLKPLDAALEGGDHIHGVIVGSAMNQDGKTFGMTAPSLLSQKDLLVSLYKKAAIHPETVSYIEAHGTGSKLGDPIEAQALTQAFQVFTDKKQFCAIGSHKPNIGHTITSAGIAGVLKVLLAMKYQKLPPTINVEEINPEIDLQSSPFFLNTELSEWKRRDGSKRRAGVSSFGLSGTNCHLILEEPPLNKKTADEQARPSFFFPLSAKTRAVFRQKVEDMINWLEKEGEQYAIEDISYTLVQGRSHFSVRSAVVAKDTNDLLQSLRELQGQGLMENESSHSLQTEPLFQQYGTWLVHELSGNALVDSKEYKEKLAVLADIYVRGYNLEWGQLFKKGRYQRVPLPTYPFLGESYWVDEKPVISAGRGKPCPPSNGSRKDIDSCHLPVREALSHMVSSLLKARVEEIDAQTPLSEYGFDSITFTELANRLNQSYQLNLTPALFFEYSTLESLAQYLYATYASVLAPYFATVSPVVTINKVPLGSSLSRQRAHIEPSAVPPTLAQAEPIAIIGMSGCFPQTPDVQSLWNNLLTGQDCIGEIPSSRWDWQTYFGDPATSNPNKTNAKWAGIVEDVELFDPQFFGISPYEAELMDPQQRLLMMYIWKAIEDAGYAASSLSGTDTALFVGMGSSGYGERISRAHRAIEGYFSTGQTPSVGPGRMSYFLNLHGPSEAIETACSSSLVAIHRGVTAIECDQCTIAIVGGVNILVSPELHMSYSKAGMLSSDGRCKTFSAQANGYVRGEGVGILMLKKLSKAQQAGDHIYGVICGSAENHGGRTTSLTAPNPRAQADLLIAAYRKAGIDPRTVGYIEAHGTGTALGDPIEINGLKTAFSELAEVIGKGPMPQASCGVGSVKSNIGHLELAAGVAGVIKVLLQLQHKQLVKSLHCEQLNPYIQLEGSPFYIVQENREWEALRDSEGNTLPRRAGVSSFGFGGANAHVVLEEYIPKPQEKQSAELAGLSRIIVLSARNEERLQEQVRQLLTWVTVGTAPCACPTCAEKSLGHVRLGQASDPRLQELAYTLQVGRVAMEERLALQVSSLTELGEKLRRYLQNPQEGGDWYRGGVRQHKDTLAFLSTDEDLPETIDKWLQRGKYEKLLQGWVKGLQIEWQHLYKEHLPRRISLPTYPFAPERYWLPTGTIPGSVRGTIPTGEPIGSLTTPSLAIVHPLVQYNISDFFEQRFSSTFDGKEFFLADHVISGQCIMPGVAYLEMARAAIAQAMRSTAQVEGPILRLRDVVWIRPLIVGEHPITVHIVLEAQESGVISFLISRAGQARGTVPTGEEGATPEVYCQGKAELDAEKITIQSLDLSAIPHPRCQHQIEARECYQRYHELGMSYGLGFQGIEQLRVGENEALARLRLPAGVAQTHTEGGKPLPYVLHPSTLDSALQACIGLLIEQNPPQEPQAQVPFALSELLVVGEMPVEGWVWVRRSPGPCASPRGTAGSVDEELAPSFDIDVCDDEGRIAVRLRGLSTRPLPGTSESLSTLLLTPCWKEEAIAPPSPSEKAHLAARHLVLPYDLPNAFASRIQAQLTSGDRCSSLTGSHPRRELRFQEAVEQLIQEIQKEQRSLMAAPEASSPVLVQVVVKHREEPSFLEGLVGVLKTAEQEDTKIWGQLIEIAGQPEEEELLVWLRENQQRPQEQHVLYRDGKRWVREWQEVSGPYVSAPPRTPWKEGGCYLITGGAGGLARLFVQEIARQVEAATIILVGRSALSASQRAQLAPKAENGGIHIDYQQRDVSDGPAVYTLIQRVLTQHGHLDGIIHAAGVLHDSLLLNKTQEEVQAVLAPKVIGTELLDEASSQISLDFFILCSSVTAVMGNVGQADYAAANAYLDAFAHERQALVLRGVRQGATLAINWPLWEEGGMQIKADARQMMRQRLGIEMMGTETGMKALYQALASGLPQVMVAHGQVERIKQRLVQSPEPLVGRVPDRREGSCTPPSSDHNHKVWQDNLRKSLTQMVSRLLKVQVEEIDAETPLSEYGFDSITFTTFANHLNQAYKLDLTPTLFFEHSTIERLVQYLQTTYATVLAPHFPVTPPEASGMTRKDFALPASKTTDKVQPQGLQVPRRHARFVRSLVYDPESLAPVAVEPIAIVGMSGMFPRAPDVQSLWSNLLTGRDCISEIPQERWNWQTYFGNPATEPNKTNVKWAGIAEDIELFDPLFFGISPSEAEQMDPQQRLLMMHIWKAIEDAGYAPSSFSGTNAALFIGTTSSGYSERLSQAGMTIEGYSATGQALSVGPNRMSYFLNLHGPSEALETACSSSLIAIHRGVNAIESGQCPVAIVGGVNILVSPQLHISYSKAGMLSSDGRCKSFGASANGYVRGEGIGILVLKKLSAAEQAGDHIYGVIRGSAENHGGRATSLTSPNPRAQADLLIAAYRKAGIDPRTVGYIETHGTGTPLGDPIEINGLKTAFSELAQIMGEEPMPQASCGIGSVKSNIGHLEWAAGVAGVIKVLLQMQHKKLVKSLHCEQPNPYIQLDGSPFYLVQENQEWGVLRDQMGNPWPRRAGVSSFGFGGANAHVVLEEYVPSLQGIGGVYTGDVHTGEASSPLRHGIIPVDPPGELDSPAYSPPLLIVLSAKNEERLHEQVQQLLAWVQAEMSAKELLRQAQPQELGESRTGAVGTGLAPVHVPTAPDQRLRDLAYTLQVGREAMEERLALQVSSFAELEEKLRRYLQEPQEKGHWYRGQVKAHKETVALLGADEEFQETIDKWIQRGKYEQLLQWWVKGLRIEWQQFYGEHLPCRISLPTYPFAHERYWIPTTKAESTESLTATTISSLATLHPLVQRNTSTLWEQRFSSTFRGDEFFFADHVIFGQRIMPGVAHLEMVRAAVALACELPLQIPIDATSDPDILRLSNIVWSHPLISNPAHPVTIQIVLETQENGMMTFLISREDEQARRDSSDPTEEESETHIYSRGTAEWYEPGDSRLRTSQSLDLPAVQARCRHQISRTEFYEHCRALGFSYGPALLGIEELSVGEGEGLARLCLPAGVAQTQADFVLHPSVLDAALQPSLWLATALPGTPKRLHVPFALAEISIAGEVPTQSWAWIRRRQSSATGQVFDVDLCDDAGRLAVQVRGLSIRPFLTEEETRTILLTPNWKEESSLQADPDPLTIDVSHEDRQTQTSQDKPLPLQAPTDALRKALVQMVSRLIKVQVERINVQAPLSEYGFDSLTFTNFANRLNQTYKLNLTPPLFYEHSTIERLAQYLQTAYATVLAPHFVTASSGVAAPEPMMTGKVPSIAPVPRRRTRIFHQPTQESGQQAHARAEPIAIIGMSGAFPQAPDLQSFWHNLHEGRDCISEIPASRWDWHAYFGSPSTPNANKTNVKWAGTLEDVEMFDPLFFGISGAEAEQMDPQQRLLMMYVWKAVEDAGYAASHLSDTDTALFVGTANSGYNERILGANIAIEGYSSTGQVTSVGPNRMSYFLNLHGPSEPIDTACSSSLVAIHRGINAIESGECRVAIVGGVNTLISPEIHISFSKAGMLCEDGRCKSFSAGANGYVRGEGVGMLVLKKLSDAERDGDHIYALIRGSAENHGGHASSLTAPNPRAQANLLIAAYSKAGIDPGTVSYIEAHGTGTPLGDPIEINGLKTAWSVLARAGADSSAGPTQQAACGIGSVKSNIGHLELAAGVAGVIKVLLQIQHKKLVKSLHCEQINPYIQLDGSSFYIVQENRDWEAIQDHAGNLLPRRAGVSSFGFGGANAHVVLEEYIPKPQSPHQESRIQVPGLVVLSAKNEACLREQAQLLHDWVTHQEGTPDPIPQSLSLQDLAYTLQVGREAMEERLALQVNSLTELEEKLRRYVEGSHKEGDWYRGQVKRHDETAALFRADEQLQEAANQWLQRGKYEQLLQGWVKGFIIDWKHLYGEYLPHRISLPTYPFTRERYWLPTSSNKMTTTATSVSTLHPLVQRNISDFLVQRFSSTFSGEEFFLAAHVISGQRLMPAVTYLEMARAAIAQATRSMAQKEQNILCLRHIMWIRPLIVSSQPVTVHITLEPQENATIAFLISREEGQEETRAEIYCQGTAEFQAENALPDIDLTAVQARCQHQLGAANCYQHYRELGITYGPAFQGIEQLCVGEDEALARFRLPEVIAHTSTAFSQHPSVLDAALQACIGLSLELVTPQEPQAQPSTLLVPFALEELSIIDELPTEGWAWVCRRPRSMQMETSTLPTPIFDIEVCDNTGRIATRLRGLTTRPFSTEEQTQTLLLTPYWQEEASPLPTVSSAFSPSSNEMATNPTPSLVLLCNLPSIEASHIQAKLASSTHCRSLPSLPPYREQRFQDAVVLLIQELQRLLQHQPDRPLFVQIVIANTDEPSLLSALIGVLKTAQQEYPKFQGQLIEVEGEPEEEELLAWLQENQQTPQVEHIRYRSGKRWVREWQEMHVGEASSPTSPPKVPWKEGGCYLITGGAGGLVRLFVQEIARHVKTATIILVGRSALSIESAAQLDEMTGRQGSTGGIRIDYQQVDVSDGSAVHALIQRVLQQHGHMDGIIHAAGVLRDSLLLNKTPEAVRTVLSPKVMGVEHLDKESRQLPLDFFILCSSLTAVVGNMGQADYAAANAYLDAFAHARRTLVLAGERQGATVSINWPLWEEGGMQIEAETAQMMRKRLGVEAMATQTGMVAFYQALAWQQAQVIVLHGQVERIKQQWLQGANHISANLMGTGRQGQAQPLQYGTVQEAQERLIDVEAGSAQGTIPTAPAFGPMEEALRERAMAYFKKQLAAIIKVPVQQVEAETSLEDYGFNSLVAIRLTNVLEDSFGPLSKTLFFQYSTLQSVTEYFLNNYPRQMRSMLGIEEAPATARLQTTQKHLWGNQRTADLLRPPTSYRQTVERKRPHRPALSPTDARANKEARVGDIAIIGLAGRYPGARDLHSFWENLRQGRDCITEIPPERWDHRLYFDPDKDKPGTTYSKWGGFLEGVDEFDPLFFNISPREAEMMDPQERLFLECVFATLEDAGYTRSWDEPKSSDKPNSSGTAQSNWSGSNVGVFVGVMYEEYQLFGAQAQIQGQSIALAGNPSSIANRVSYVCNFHGPSIAVDTMCSSSLTAIHMACQSIEQGDCELAIAGGVNVSIHPNKYLFLGQGKFVSSLGHCQSFGEGADGYVPGEGVGAVLLKPLAQAEADGDHIYGVIKATAINHGGKTNGYTVPNPQAQAEVIGRALRKAGIDPRTISYIEAHGTGTVLGDPIEIAGLTLAFQQATQDHIAPAGMPEESHCHSSTSGWCAIGSVKSNIGHAESAAGIAGVTKVLLQMHYEQLVPSLHAEVLNPHIDFSDTPFVVQRELSEWKRPQENRRDRVYPCPRRAGISSFGAGGSNAHVILEEYVDSRGRGGRSHPGACPDEGTKGSPSSPVLIVLSARTQEQLHERVHQLLSWIQEYSQWACPTAAQEDLANLAYTLQVGREPMAERLALQVESLRELEEKLRRYIEGSQEEGDWYRGQVKRYDPMGAFAADEDGQKAIAAWMSKGKYEKLLEWWVKGLTIDWQYLYAVGVGSAQGTGSARGTTPTVAPTPPRRISLPTYPFARERYWIPIETSTTIGAGPRPTATKRATLRPLVDPPVLSDQWSENCKKEACPLPDLTSPTEVDQPEPSTSGAESSEEPYMQSTMTDKQIALPIEARSEQDPGQDLVGAQTEEIEGTGQGQALSLRTPIRVPTTSVLEEELAKSLAETLYMKESDIDVAQPFVEMGLDSVVGVEWVKSLNKQYAINLATSRLYDYPTIRQLAGFLQKEGLQPQPQQVTNTAHQPEEREGGTIGAVSPPINPTYQRVIVERAGGIDDLIIGEANMQELKDHEVRVAVRAFSLNFGDLLCVKGLYPTMPPYPFTPGFETSGVVIDVGQAVTAFKIGDPVITIAGATLGGHANVMTCSEELVFHKPATLSFEEACALPVVATTVIAAFEKARLKRGEKILIHTATGGTGLIAIQLAKYYQAQIYATAGSQAKLDYLKQLGVPYRINYQETDFEQEIKHLTHDKGIDVVINTLSGNAVQKGINCLSSGGRYIELAMTALKSARTIDLSVLSQNQTFYSVDLRRLAQTDPATLKHYCHEMFHLVEERIITPTICQVFTWERIKDAYRSMENRQHIGKIVVRIPEANQVSYTAPESHLQEIRMETSSIGANLDAQEAIAIVGMSGRYPDARNLTDFWNNLVQGKNAIREIPLSHFDISDYYDPDSAACGKISSKWLGVLDEIEYFDPSFFHLSPTEVEAMDPQHRLFLEEGYKAFEDAGYSPALLSNRKCGVYLGIGSHDYGPSYSQHSAAEIRLFGTSSAIAAARLAYLLNLKGPAISVDTACSSSLVATHLACQALRCQEIDMALVGGVSLCLTPDFYIGMCNAGMLSPDGQCKTFDASANGFVPGEGVGALVLKRLADAEVDHDQIYGVIIGSGMNQDGATNGISAPSVKSQIELEREIYEKYQIDPESISYVEMHGTGTKLGDPIELEALATVFQEQTQRKQYCAIGSVKSNIGHTLAAAGIAGLQKVLLAMKQKKLVPTLHFEQPNPHFDFAASPFYVNTQVQDWSQALGTPRHAAVSSFGFSGTNAHLVVEEYISTRAGISPLSRNTETPCLFVLSAKSEPQLKSYAQEMKHWIQAHEELALENIAFTLQVGREALEYRLAIVADSREVLLQRLEAFIDRQASARIHTGQVEKKTTSDATLFEVDADGKSLLHIWCQERDLEKISQSWVKGVNVNWMLLYTVGAGPAQGTGSEPRTAIGFAPMATTAPALPHRISLPTYPFVRKRYWIPTGASATIGAVGHVGARTGASPVPTAPDPMATKRVTLRSLADPPLHLGNRADQPQPSISLSKLAQPFSRSKSDDVVAPGQEPVESQTGTVGTGSAQGTIPTAPVRVPSIPSDSTLQTPGDIGENLSEKLHTQARENVETVWSAVDLGLAPELEQELVRSLAKALDTEESDIDVEKPFGEMGLDSVIGVEWIRALNKQYASNLNASSVYDYPSIRQLAGFLQKVLVKQQQTSVSSTSALSLDDILQKIQQRDLPPDEAIRILSSILSSKQKSKI